MRFAARVGRRIPPSKTKPMRPLRRIPLALLAALLVTRAPANERPRLQIINGSSQPIDIFWLKSDTERVPNGSVAPGKDTIITTTLGHRFAVVGRDDKTTATVTSEVPVQGFRFDPPGKNGVPAFYTQAVSANGFPIVASAKVNPYALKEAAFLVDLMLAKRPDVREAMIKSGARMCIMAHNEYTTDLPEFAAGRRADARLRGISGKDYLGRPRPRHRRQRDRSLLLLSPRKTCSAIPAIPTRRSASSSTSSPTTSTCAAW